MANPTVLILASGRGERFLASGGTTHKLEALLPANGYSPVQTVLQRTLDAVIATGLPYHLERQAHAGMGDTIAAAVGKTRAANGWLILPADMPYIDPVAIRAVADALNGGFDANARQAIVAPCVRGQRGHPVGFPSSALSALLALRGDDGAKSIFKQLPLQTIHVDQMPSVKNPEGCLIDIDTVDDLKRHQLAP
jgi:molybdenum cofactor cytidylyltransferase